MSGEQGGRERQAGVTAVYKVVIDGFSKEVTLE
jgi:hypothetical protein